MHKILLYVEVGQFHFSVVTVCPFIETYFKYCNTVILNILYYFKI